MTTAQKTTASDAIRALAEKHGKITAELVLKSAEKKSSPLHSHFDWDDSSAARRYRLVQAGELIRRIKVEYIVSETNTVRVRAFHNVSDQAEEDPETYYVSLSEALTVESYHAQLMANCKRDMNAFRQKYAALSEVSCVISAMDDFAA
jgi:hypothetical protein